MKRLTLTALAAFALTPLCTSPVSAAPKRARRAAPPSLLVGYDAPPAAREVSDRALPADIFDLP